MTREHDYIEHAKRLAQAVGNAALNRMSVDEHSMVNSIFDAGFDYGHQVGYMAGAESNV